MDNLLDPVIAAGSGVELRQVDLPAGLAHLPGVAVPVIDHDLRYLGAGGAGLEASGWDPTELVGRRLAEVVPEDEAARLEGPYRAALAGEVVRFTIRGVRRPDRVHQTEVIPIRDRSGSVTSAMVIARDLTDLVAHEEAAAHAEQRLRALVDSSGDMLALYDVDGVYLEVSRAARTLFGWEPSELVGTSSYDYFHAEDLALISSTHAEVLQTEQVGAIEYRLRCKDGTYRWVEVIGRNLHDPETGQLTTIQCTTRDISRRKAAEAALRASEERFHTAMDHAPIGPLLVDMDGTLVAVNDEFAALVGVDRDTLVGTSYHDLLARGAVELPPQPVGPVGQGQDAPTVLKVRFRRDDGVELHLDLHIAVVRGPDGAPASAIVQVVDTTAARQAVAELQRANGELQRFASVASHDLRSPVATARGLLELLDSRIPLPEDSPARDIAQRAGLQLARLGDTIDALLELTRAGTEPLRVRDIPATALLEEVTDALDSLADLAGSTVHLDADATLTGDPRLLRSLLQNLASNALRSTDQGRPVHVLVSASRDADGWALAVTDDGDGIPEDLRDRLFEPFAHADRQGQLPGHGLGMAICRRIVERHGGSIEVDHLDPGTRIRVSVLLRGA